MLFKSLGIIVNEPPQSNSIQVWFNFIQKDRLIGLVALNFFDIINRVCWIIRFLKKGKIKFELHWLIWLKIDFFRKRLNWVFQHSLIPEIYYFKLFDPINKLQYLPNSIGQLKNLRVLNLTLNRIDYLPSSIGELLKLERLSLVMNCIKEIPEKKFLFYKLLYLLNK